MQQGFVSGGPRVLLRIEGLAYVALRSLATRRVAIRGGFLQR
jgi:hypothetical protein